jgi:tRNA(Ile)-lysidine synthase
LLEVRGALGLILSVAHVHHGLRRTAADEDAAFVGKLAREYGLPMHLLHLRRSEPGTPASENASRELRYSFFTDIIANGSVDSVATAHTADDQAETVVMKLLRGAWTEGIGGIAPILPVPKGRIVRPFLQVRRTEILLYLRSLNQAWREDATNTELDFTRNRVRLQLLPQLREFNPNIDVQLARTAEIAREEELHWQAEIDRLLPHLTLPGRPVRGGGRSVSPATEVDSVALDVERMQQLNPATRRRILRAAARQAGCSVDFEATARLMDMLQSPAGTKAQLGGGLYAERTQRELHLATGVAIPNNDLEPITFSLPGEVAADAFGLRLRVRPEDAMAVNEQATLRVWRPGDRVRLRHTLSERKIKEVLQQQKATAEQRASWPVIEWRGHIAWLRGVALEPEAGARLVVEEIA